MLLMSEVDTTCFALPLSTRLAGSGPADIQANWFPARDSQTTDVFLLDAARMAVPSGVHQKVTVVESLQREQRSVGAQAAPAQRWHRRMHAPEWKLGKSICYGLELWGARHSLQSS